MGKLKSQILTSHCKWNHLQRLLSVIVLCLCTTIMTTGELSGQTFELQKSVDNTTPDAGEVFNYTINASCSSSTQDCESVVITDPLPPTLDYLGTSFPWPDGVADVVYDPLAHDLTITFDASAANCPSCTPDGINTDEDDFSQGSSIQLTVQVRFGYDAFEGTTADNTVYGTSDNAGNPSAPASTVTVAGGLPPATGCDQLYDGFRAVNVAPAGGTTWTANLPANGGFSDITNLSLIHI